MPISSEEFEKATPVKPRKKLQTNILKILRKNPRLAVSSIELENILDVRRQAIHQACRALEEKGLIERGFIKENNRYVAYVKIAGDENEQNEN